MNQWLPTYSAHGGEQLDRSEASLVGSCASCLAGKAVFLLQDGSSNNCKCPGGTGVRPGPTLISVVWGRNTNEGHVPYVYIFVCYKSSFKTVE